MLGSSFSVLGIPCVQSCILEARMRRGSADASSSAPSKRLAAAIGTSGLAEVAVPAVGQPEANTSKKRVRAKSPALPAPGLCLTAAPAVISGASSGAPVAQQLALRKTL